ncbi:MAG TPA: flagellar motor switch protein FliN [Tepidisphaeraceae bacterium]|jgi:flagellar motor switch protein FliN/FliY|nr:flagellar motor switch protein FliN [Tepidisphaeraceae bacterium]
MAEEVPSPTPADAGQPAAASAQPQDSIAVNPPQPSEAKTEASVAVPAGEPAADALDQLSIEELLKQASFEDPAALGEVPAATDTEPFKLPNFQQVIQEAQVSNIDLLRDVELNVKIELGRARMLVEDVLKLNEGSVVELDKLAGDPVDVFVNERLVARGEVLVLNDNFCVRVNEIVAGAKDEGL